MIWPHGEVYPDAVQRVMTQLNQVDQDTPLPPLLRARVQARIGGLVSAVPFAKMPLPPTAEPVTHLAVFFDLAEAQAQQLLQALTAAPGPLWIPSGLPGVSLLLLARVSLVQPGGKKNPFHASNTFAN